MSAFKKLLAPIFSVSAIAGVLLLGGCSDSTPSADQTAQSSGADAKTVALVVSTLNNPFFVSLRDGAEARARELGYKLVVLDSQNDSSREVANVEDLTVKGVQVILLNPTDSDAAGNVVRIANRANIPVITLDRAANGGEVASHVASDNTAGGRMAGEFIVEMIGNEGTVLQLEGVPGASATRERGAGFMAALNNSNVTLAASQTADFDRTRALNVTENMLQAHPDVKAIFAQNDEMALGAITAVRAAQKSIPVIGFDGTDEGIAAVQQGHLAGTVAQQAAVIGSKGVDVADQVIRGEQVAAQTPVELQLVRRS